MFKWLVLGALIVSAAVIAAHEFLAKRAYDARLSELAQRQAEMKPLAPIDAEVRAYQKKKSLLEHRIDAINPIKQAQPRPDEVVAMVAAIETDRSIDAVAVIDDNTIVINGHGDASAVSKRFEHATTHAGADQTFSVQVTR